MLWPRSACATATGLVTAVATVVVGCAAGSVSQPARAVRLGGLAPHRCAVTPLTYCGSLAVPLDYSAPGGPRIQIGFRWLPAAAPRPSGTLLAVEGGPGYATSGSQSAYLAMLGPLAATRNLLLVDLRGTGTSTPIDCPGLQTYERLQQQVGPAFNQLVAACGEQLNRTWRYRDGTWVHASDLFSTANAARDVAAMLDALGLGRVDLFGDSYGSWFAQVFASRYSGRLRSLTLDSPYQVLALDPWYTSTVATAREAFTQACARSAACAAAASPAGAWSRIGALAASLARSPVTGLVPGPDGVPAPFTVTAGTLVNLVNNAGFDPMVDQDLDAAARALLAGHDPVPLLRLAALSIGYDNANNGLPEFSDGLYFAVACTDYPQLFSASATPGRRASQYLAALHREPPGTFAPFSVGAWTQMDQYNEAYSACLGWPAPRYQIPPVTARPPLVPASLPVLILSGGLDSMTPWLDGATVVAGQLGPSARPVRVENLTHVTVQVGNSSCLVSIFRRFLDRPAGLARQDVSCAARVAPIHTVGAYPLRFADAVPAIPVGGRTAGPVALRAVSVALASVGDEISRWPLLSGGDVGLRGGRVRFSGGQAPRIVLTGVRWVTDATVTGTAIWDQSTGWVTADLTVSPPGAAPVHLKARWQRYGQPSQPTQVTGTQGSAHFAAESPAP